MPRSVFLGRPMPGPGEPLWTREDRDWALALLHIEADACPSCRQPWGEASDPKSEFGYRAEIVRCHACATGQRAMENYQKQHGDLRGALVQVIRDRS